jgi:hypothetical protein
MDESDLVLAWLRAFVVTWVVELLVLTPLLCKEDKKLGRCVGVITLGQIASHPLVWFVFPVLELPYLVYCGIAELWAVVVEAALYRLVYPSLTLKRAGLLSLAANGASVVVGLILRRFGLV